jgi:SAM-dependent methyltransferase
MTLRPWPIEWTAEQIADYWTWAATAPAMRDTYFTKLVGHDVLRVIESKVRLREPVLDLGAGPGDLTTLLLTSGYETWAAENSEPMLRVLRSRFGAHPRFRGAVLSNDRVDFPSGTAGTVLLIETIEHLPAPVLGPLLAEISRVLVAGGQLVITTPNAEALEGATFMCPSCHCLYHKNQHMRSLTAESLRALVEPHGFVTGFVGSTRFTPLRGWHRRLEAVRRRVERLKNDEHLLYVGTTRATRS